MATYLPTQPMTAISANWRQPWRWANLKIVGHFSILYGISKVDPESKSFLLDPLQRIRERIEILYVKIRSLSISPLGSQNSTICTFVCNCFSSQPNKTVHNALQNGLCTLEWIAIKFQLRRGQEKPYFIHAVLKAKF